MTRVSRDDLTALCRAALVAVGATAHEARVLAEATVEAELVGNRAVGAAHLVDHLTAYAEGRIAVDAQPRVRRTAPAVVDVDARGGLAQVAFGAAAGELEDAVRSSGVAALWVRGSYTCGELGYYARRVAERGLLALAVANSNALMSLGGATTPVLGTNPVAYAVPRAGKPPVVVDQASSSTAFVNVRRAAAAGQEIPRGWAIGPDGRETQDARAALQGALLPFGGHRGGNVALLVELLATLSGGSFSLDAPPFDRGSASPGIGVFVLGVDPDVFPGSLDRLTAHLEVLRDVHGVRLPALELDAYPDAVDVAADLLDRLREAGGLRSRS